MGAQWKAKGKELAASVRGKLFGRLAKDIMVAARNGADPASNSKLRLVVEQARKVSMPKETLERAIKKGAGLTGEAVHFEHVIYEGFAPHQDHLGIIEAEATSKDADAETAAIEAGAQDFEAGDADEDGKVTTTIFYSDATDLDLVSRALPAHGFTVLSAKLGYKAKNPVDPSTLSAEQLEEVEAFLSAIDGNDDVQNVYVGLAG
jgi:transcriptional/translational regulatory protein YebC/TACO1